MRKFNVLFNKFHYNQSPCNTAYIKFACYLIFYKITAEKSTNIQGFSKSSAKYF